MCKGRCKVQQFMLAEGRAARTGRSRRLAARLMRELRNDPPSMHQSRCQCSACRQAIPAIPFTAHQLLAKLLVPDGETAPRPPRTRPNRKRRPQLRAASRRSQAHGREAVGFFVVLASNPEMGRAGTRSTTTGCIVALNASATCAKLSDCDFPDNGSRDTIREVACPGARSRPEPAAHSARL
jgi:hypothetical protein